MSKKFLLGVYDDEEKVLSAIHNIRSAGNEVYDVYSPFAIHGMEDAMGIKRTRLTVAAFCFGLLGFTLALSMQVFMLVIDWPMNIGGKPFFSGPSFVPISFELTILLTALGMVFTFFYVSRLAPGIKADIPDLRVTDDIFILAMESSGNAAKDSEIAGILTSHGALEIREREVKA
jgi:hypothetical protein